ncbi:hypothetical protein ACFQ3P_14485 [Paraburkholderia sabiae]|uniref:Uncharacterized protein n=1 Tax=Paraburkholderia sabiae TaxID=273251 RepID=A0ABU9Q8F4_9BURK|nr:hypothetical protein [Paraburkholderia sabiae]WJZ77712.1 hypothetical protein QEN71_37340 [Paraburkholderia sabiae]CAD6532989.1 hypothetical protein LMG24235_02693 [Paraburkholderia sabiae]
MITRRTVVTRLMALGLFYPLVACGDQKRGIFMNSKVVLNVVLFSYLDRPIFDVLLNGADIGAAGAYGGGRGVIAGMTVSLGSQTLTWRLDGPEGTSGNGDTVTATNALSLSSEQIPSRGMSYLGVHVYPDSTAELIVSPHFSEPSPRGELIYKERHLYGR